MPAKIRTASRLRNRPSLLTAADNCHRRATPSDMLNRAYLDQTLRRPLPLKDGRILRTPINQLFFGHDVGTGVIYQDANVKVTAIENSHFDFHKGPASGKHKSYSYRFDTPDRVIVFTGDTGPSDTVTELARGADLLVSEANSVEDRMQLLIKSGQWQVMTPDEQVRIKQQMAEGHLSPDVIGKMAARAGVKTVVLTHLTAKPDDDYTPWANEVKKHFSGEVLVAKDLMEF
jgi:ribonuclease BN (tRNA processing enzyme)